MADPAWSPAELLPHGAAFRFVSEVLRCADGSATATWLVAGDESFLSAHFPGNPIVPGVLIGEALAQAAGIALHTAPDVRLPKACEGQLAHVDLKFRAVARPPVAIELVARHVGSFGALHRFDVVAKAGTAVLASGQLVLSVRPDSDATATPA